MSIGVFFRVWCVTLDDLFVKWLIFLVRFHNDFHFIGARVWKKTAEVPAAEPSTPVCGTSCLLSCRISAPTILIMYHSRFLAHFSRSASLASLYSLSIGPVFFLSLIFCSSLCIGCSFELLFKSQKSTAVKGGECCDQSEGNVLWTWSYVWSCFFIYNSLSLSLSPSLPLSFYLCLFLILSLSLSHSFSVSLILSLSLSHSFSRSISASSHLFLFRSLHTSLSLFLSLSLSFSLSFYLGLFTALPLLISPIAFSPHFPIWIRAVNKRRKKKDFSI